MRKFPERLLLSNRAWVVNRLELKSRYFRAMAKAQKPQALWIGCSDSRVPSEEITGARPGELFVHRNVANVILANDKSLESVLYYSLLVLKVQHIILCGHTRCGGVQAAVQGISDPYLNDWLAPIKKLVPSTHKPDLETSPPAKIMRTIVRLNVIRGVEQLRQHPIVRQAWQDRTLSLLHGWVYQLETGRIVPACEATPQTGAIRPIEEYRDGVQML